MTSSSSNDRFLKLVAIWMLSHWLNFGRSKTIRLVELGPGRGTLMADVLRVSVMLLCYPITVLMRLISQVFSQFSAARSAVKEIHLVETSPAMQEIQNRTLQPIVKDQSWSLHWHDALGEISPDQDVYTMVLAHEFFDALPFHLLLVYACVAFLFLRMG